MKRTTEELLAIVEVPLIESAIDSLIKNEITVYNTVSKTRFKDIDALQKYTRNANYPHYAFCVSMLDWNELVWETAGQLQEDILEGIVVKPVSVAAFIALLPVRV